MTAKIQPDLTARLIGGMVVIIQTHPDKSPSVIQVGPDQIPQLRIALEAFERKVEDKAITAAMKRDIEK